jgi:hypothetical protein
MYHGTTSNFVPDILRSGLVPKPQNAWKVAVAFDDVMMTPDDSDRVGNIYVSPDRKGSIWYAVNKAAYYRTKPNHLFKWYQYIGEDMETAKLEPTYLAKKLDDNLYIPDAKPVLFQVMVIPSIKRQLVPDEKDHNSSLRCMCIIPPKYLKLIWQG